MIIVIGDLPSHTLQSLLTALASQGVHVLNAESVRVNPSIPEGIICDSSDRYEPTYVNAFKVRDNVDEVDRWRAELKRLCRAAIENLMLWHARALRPWLLLAKRFDFRSSPRWSALRWKSKT